MCLLVDSPASQGQMAETLAYIQKLSTVDSTAKCEQHNKLHTSALFLQFKSQNCKIISLVSFCAKCSTHPPCSCILLQQNVTILLLSLFKKDMDETHMQLLVLKTINIKHPKKSGSRWTPMAYCEI
jgi:hypothetical protein